MCYTHEWLVLLHPEFTKETKEKILRNILKLQTPLDIIRGLNGRGRRWSLSLNWTILRAFFKKNKATLSYTYKSN